MLDKTDLDHKNRSCEEIDRKIITQVSIISISK